MVKLILSIALFAMVFSGCVGTLAKNDATTKSNTRVTKGVKDKSKAADDKNKVIKKVRPIQ